jgi:hypothetical protein
MTTTTGNPPLDLGLTEDEDIFVRDTARSIYKVSYLNSLDNAMMVARAIRIIRERSHGQGVQGGFDAALIAYGYTSRDGKTAIDPAIRSQLKELLEQEEEVRAWWWTLSDNAKRNWLSPSSIHRQYMKWKRHGPQLKRNDRGANLADQLAVARDEIADLKERLESALAYIDKLESGATAESFSVRSLQEEGSMGLRPSTWVSPLRGGEKRHWKIDHNQRKKTSERQ